MHPTRTHDCSCSTSSNYPILHRLSHGVVFSALAVTSFRTYSRSAEPWRESCASNFPEPMGGSDLLLRLQSCVAGPKTDRGKGFPPTPYKYCIALFLPIAAFQSALVCAIVRVISFSLTLTCTYALSSLRGKDLCMSFACSICLYLRKSKIFATSPIAPRHENRLAGRPVSDVSRLKADPSRARASYASRAQSFFNFHVR